MTIKEIGPIDLKTSSVTDGVLLDGSPFSVQPVNQRNICGNPTWTLEISNDKENYITLNKDSTNVDMFTPVQVNYNPIPWKYIRLSITCSLGDSGKCGFKICKK